MPNKKTDKQGFSTLEGDKERDMAAKGGPAMGPGISDNAHDIPHPYDEDIQTQLAAKSTENKNKDIKTDTRQNSKP